ncbi:hypothetical protein Tco_0132386 [Tanacetum coccineum]
MEIRMKSPMEVKRRPWVNYNEKLQKDVSISMIGVKFQQNTSLLRSLCTSPLHIRLIASKYKRISPPKYLQILGGVLSHEVEEVCLLSVLIRIVSNIMRRGEGMRFENFMLLDQSLFFGIVDIHLMYMYNFRADLKKLMWLLMKDLEQELGAYVLNKQLGSNEKKLKSLMADQEALCVSHDKNEFKEPQEKLKQEIMKKYEKWACSHGVFRGCLWGVFRVWGSDLGNSFLTPKEVFTLMSHSILYNLSLLSLRRLARTKREIGSGVVGSPLARALLLPFALTYLPYWHLDFHDAL